MAFLALTLLLGCPPAEKPPLAGASTCLLSNCHAAVEQIHYGGPPLSCVDCHGGDNTQTTKKGAHVTVDVSFNPSTPGSQFLDVPTAQELDALDPAVIRFLNPSDYRVARTTCGAPNGVTCHFNIVESSLLLNRATLSGQLAGGGFIAGTQDKTAQYGIVDADDRYTPDHIPEGHVDSLEMLPAEVPDHITDPVARAYFPLYEQLCVECHVNRDGRRTPGLYYSSGCNACHMVTDNDARAKTGDITQDIDELGHVSTHRFTNLVPDSQCAHCHISHLGRAFLIRGLRERSEHEGDQAFGGPNRGVEDPEEAVPWGEENYARHNGRLEIYGKPYPYYLEDEDGTNDVDETPPDVHTAAGLGCIDCHNIRESHGDSQLAERMDQEIDVRCENCHGNPGNRATLRSQSGVAFTQSMSAVGGTGDNPMVFQGDDRILQRGRFTNALHPVTQITERADPEHWEYNPRTAMGCTLHAGTAEARTRIKNFVNLQAVTDPTQVDDQFPGLPEGFQFTLPAEETDGRLECFSCHNQWTVNCYGCHMVRDDRESYTSLIDGQTRKGKAFSFGMSVVADGLSLGFNARGRISPMVGTSIFFTHVDDKGNKAIDAVPLTDGHGVAGEGNVHNPVHHHTIRKEPRDCHGCHPSATGSHDEAALLTATGIGSGRYTFEDGTGRVHLLDRLVQVDVDGDGTPDTPTTLPASITSADPVVSTTHTALTPEDSDPGPLDATAINGMLQNVVVPQR